MYLSLLLFIDYLLELCLMSTICHDVSLQIHLDIEYIHSAFNACTIIYISNNKLNIIKCVPQQNLFVKLSFSIYVYNNFLNHWWRYYDRPTWCYTPYMDCNERYRFVLNCVIIWFWDQGHVPSIISYNPALYFIVKHC